MFRRKKKEVELPSVLPLDKIKYLLDQMLKACVEHHGLTELHIDTGRIRGDRDVMTSKDLEDILNFLRDRLHIHFETVQITERGGVVSYTALQFFCVKNKLIDQVEEAMKQIASVDAEASAAPAPK
jgi:capsule polysaccharide export protein KpsE/RkpR